MTRRKRCARNWRWAAAWEAAPLPIRKRGEKALFGSAIGGGSASETGAAFAVKLLAFTIAISAGVIGGTFAPSLFIGSALGAAIGHGAHDLFPAMHIDPKAYAVIGMGSFFACLMRSPIAAVLFVVELTRDYELIVPLMLGVSLAVAVSRRISRLSIVEQQMVDEGWIEEQGANDPLARVRVTQAMTANLVSIPTPRSRRLRVTWPVLDSRSTR